MAKFHLKSFLLGALVSLIMWFAWEMFLENVIVSQIGHENDVSLDQKTIIGNTTTTTTSATTSPVTKTAETIIEKEKTTVETATNDEAETSTNATEESARESIADPKANEETQSEAQPDPEKVQNQNTNENEEEKIPLQSETIPPMDEETAARIKLYQTLNLTQPHHGASPLYDRTLPWNATVIRPWMTASQENHPSFMLLMTNMGWNNPDQTYGMSQMRGLRTRELMEGVINHEYFHPTAWQDIVSENLDVYPDVKYYVFLDQEVCSDKNYPRYGHGVMGNRDVQYNRGIERRNFVSDTSQMLSSKFFVQHNVTLVVFDCNGWGPGKEITQLRHLLDQEGRSHVMSVVSLSNRIQDASIENDLGLMPPACRKFVMTDQERQDIESCRADMDNTTRPLFLSFSGLMRVDVRKYLAAFDNEQDIRIYGSLKGKDQLMKAYEENDIGRAYQKLAGASKFAAAPKGDNLFSYRFAEVIQMGAIPVLFADDWLLPFGEDLFDWNEIIVQIPEAQVNHTVEILSRITPQQRCRMRRRLMEIYDLYLENQSKIAGGIVDALEARRKRMALQDSSSTRPLSSLSSPPPEEEECNPATQQQQQSPLNDKTLCYKTNIEREWLKLGETESSSPPPPAMLLLTNGGWNTPDTSQGLDNWPRSMYSRRMTEGIINHPWFHPSGYDDLINNRLNASSSIRYLIFLDAETCGGRNMYYNSGNKSPYIGPIVEMDLISNRTNDWSHTTPRRLHLLRKQARRGIMGSTIQSSGATWDFVYLDCNGYGPNSNVRNQQDPNDDRNTHLVVLSASSTLGQAEIGLPLPSPFAPHSDFISLQQQQDWDICQEDRPILLGFSGHLRTFVRRSLQSLHDGEKIMVGEPNDVLTQFASAHNINDEDKARLYMKFLSQTSFGAVPRGTISTSRGTSRLLEVMSSGAIPVIYSDEALLPLTPVINWNEIAVIIPEQHVLDTLSILSRLSPERTCQMRRDMYAAFTKYLSSEEKIMKAVVEILVPS